jgi:hypothetical protein
MGEAIIGSVAGSGGGAISLATTYGLTRNAKYLNCCCGLFRYKGKPIKENEEESDKNKTKKENEEEDDTNTTQEDTTKEENKTKQTNKNSTKEENNTKNTQEYTNQDV